MRTKKLLCTQGLTLIVLVFAFGCLLAGCEPTVETDSCVDCHTDKETLKEVADAIEVSEDSGEG